MAEIVLYYACSILSVTLFILDKLMSEDVQVKPYS